MCKKLHGLRVEAAIRSYGAAWYLSVARNRSTGKTPALPLACGEDALPNRGGFLAALRAHHVVERHARDLDLEIDAVEQRAGEFGDIFRHRCVVAPAFRVRIPR